MCSSSFRSATGRTIWTVFVAALQVDLGRDRAPGRAPAARQGPSAACCTNRFIMTPRDAFYSDSELVNVNDSVGRVSTEIVTVYPPGIPLLVPGEEISQDAIELPPEHGRPRRHHRRFEREQYVRARGKGVDRNSLQTCAPIYSCFILIATVTIQVGCRAQSQQERDCLTSGVSLKSRTARAKRKRRER